MGIRAGLGLSLKERKTYTFGDFKGVDFSTSPYLVKQNRATYAENLIYENGTVRKRTGWKSLCKLPEEINGLFSFEIENEEVLLAYSGTTFYRLIWNEHKEKYDFQDITNTCSYDPAGIIVENLKSQRIQLYVNKNKAYIIGCGDYLVYGKWNGKFELRRVFNNEDTYIPTTTINIDKDGVNDTNKASLDDVNLMSSYRKNEFLGVDEDSATWTVDTAIKGVEQAIDSDSTVNITVYTCEEENPVVINISNSDLNKSLLYKETGEEVGSIDFILGKITLNINTKPQETNTSNIIVTFKKTMEEQEDIICNATISTIFGGNGNSNRLFLSGYNGLKNKHVWSEMYDFTYFGTNNHDEIGTDSSAIVGYVRATDGTLIVFKEKNGSDSTIYYITGTDNQGEDYNGDPVFVTNFHKTAGNVTDTIYGKYATASLNGDNLILTRNGIKGLELYENITTSAYRLRERSRNINSKLLKQINLQEASGFVYKDKYYLSVDGVTYVCDSRFTFSAEEDISDSFNYEWWYFTNVDARVWCEINNKLFFGTNTGMICVFTEDEYCDETFQDTEVGDITIDYEQNKVVYNIALDYSLNTSSSLEFTNGDVYSLFLKSTDILSIDKEGYLCFDESLLDRIYEGREVYADWDLVSGLENWESVSGLNVNTKYIIGEVDLDNLRFSLLNENYEQIKPLCLGFRLCNKVSKKTLYIDNINYEEQEFQVREFKGGRILDLVIYNYSTPLELKATLKFKENVVASWYTPIYDLGSNMFSKTLLGLTITTEPLVKGAITVGYQTRNIDSFTTESPNKKFVTYGSPGFDFNDLDFENFSFDGAFTNSNTIRIKERNFNFIILKYVSDTQSACAVNGITIRYKINRLNKGVR